MPALAWQALKVRRSNSPSTTNNAFLAEREPAGGVDWESKL
jgi:hypothetical protein